MLNMTGRVTVTPVLRPPQTGASMFVALAALNASLSKSELPDEWAMRAVARVLDSPTSGADFRKEGIECGAPDAVV